MIWTVLLAAVVALSGCGGGGGTTTPVHRDNVVLTGTVLDVSTNSPVVGATVTIGTYTDITTAQGTFSIGMPAIPIVQTYSVNGEHATPDPGYYPGWSSVGGKTYDAKSIPLPLVPLGETSLGTIYLMNASSPPPPPPGWSN